MCLYTEKGRCVCAPFLLKNAQRFDIMKVPVFMKIKSSSSTISSSGRKLNSIPNLH